MKRQLSARRVRGLVGAGLLVTLLLVAACAQPAANAGPTALKPNADGYIDIKVEQLEELLASEEVLVVNVHIPYEGDIPGTDASIPFDEIQNRLDQLPADKDAPIVLYCRSGPMSTSAAKVLAAEGYTQIYELDGGMRAWEAAGNKLVYK
mgnify:CR=1 FL=1